MWGDEVVYVRGSETCEYLRSVAMLGEDEEQEALHFEDDDNQQLDQWQDKQIFQNQKRENTQTIIIPFLGQIHYLLQQVHPPLMILIIILLAFLLIVYFYSSLLIALFLLVIMRSLDLGRQSNELFLCIDALINYRRLKLSGKNFKQQTVEILINKSIIRPLCSLSLIECKELKVGLPSIQGYLQMSELVSALKKLHKRENPTKTHQILERIIMCAKKSVMIFYLSQFLKDYELITHNQLQEQTNQNQGKQIKTIQFHSLVLYQLYKALENKSGPSSSLSLFFSNPINIKQCQILKILKILFESKLSLADQQFHSTVKKQAKIFQNQQEISIMQPVSSSSKNKYRILSINEDTILQQSCTEHQRNLSQLKNKLDLILKKRAEKQEEEKVKQQKEKEMKEKVEEEMKRRQRRVEGFGMIRLPKVKLESSYYLQ